MVVAWTFCSSWSINYDVPIGMYALLACPGCYCCSYSPQACYTENGVYGAGDHRLKLTVVFFIEVRHVMVMHDNGIQPTP